MAGECHQPDPRGSGCPAARSRGAPTSEAAVEPERSLAVARPDLVAELDPNRNDDLEVTTLGIASMRKVWWRCGQCEHSWETTVASRAGATGCPAGWNRRRGATFGVVPQERSLAHRAPQVADELHPNRNPPGRDPLTLGARSSKTVWWLCGLCGHEWQARVADRATGTRCPTCARDQRPTVAA